MLAQGVYRKTLQGGEDLGSWLLQSFSGGQEGLVSGGGRGSVLGAPIQVKRAVSLLYMRTPRRLMYPG